MKQVARIVGYLCVLILVLIVATAGNSGGNAKEKSGQRSGWIGIAIQDVNEKIAKIEKLESKEGVYVNEVMKKSPADSAGIKEGDVIIKMDGIKVLDSDIFQGMIRNVEPGTKVELAIIREGKKQTIGVVVGERKAPKHRTHNMSARIPGAGVYMGNNALGVKASTLSEQLGEYFGAPNNEGVLVEEVIKKSPADKAGFLAGDVIIRIANKNIDEVGDIRRALAKYDEGGKVEIEILRKGAKKILNVEIEESPARKNFFFHQFPGHGFIECPIEDIDIDIDMDGFEPDLKNIQIELKKNMENFEDNREDIKKQVERITDSVRRSVCL